MKASFESLVYTHISPLASAAASWAHLAGNKDAGNENEDPRAADCKSRGHCSKL